jgi:L-threonylcarbamoyladenylate synthase
MEITSNCTVHAVSNAAQALIDGHLVAFPTETVYGLGADATNEKAVSRIYSVKGRPVGHPLIVHISSINKLDQWATNIPDYAIKLAREFWPGPMTLILPRTDLAKDFITGGQSNVGLRVPAQPIAIALLKKFEELGGQGVAAPSANRFGAVSPTTAGAVDEELGDYLEFDDLVLDGGACLVGIESTIIDCTKKIPEILRPGIVSESQIRGVVSQLEIRESIKSIIKVSGNLLTHYSPRAKVLINAKPKPGDGLIALSEISTPDGVVRLASPNSSKEFAQQLYLSYRQADKREIQRIVVVLPEGDDISSALKDRVSKSAK